MVLLSLCCIVLPVASLAQTEEMRLARFPKSSYQYVSAQILTDVYRKAGLTGKAEPMPPSRAPLEALAGRIDGEISRVLSHGDTYPGMVRVEPAYNYFTMTAFSRLPIAIESRTDLKKYRIGVVRGVQAAAEITEGLTGVELAPNSESLFLMLSLGRFDIAIDVDINGSFQIAKNELKGVRSVGVLQKSDGYHYLAPHKAQLQPRIAAAIVEMRRTGELERLRRKYTAAFIALGIEPE
jgi:ABC-type amino acid transport substrate-binding protein